MDLELLKASLARYGEPAYRSDQIWRWAAQGCTRYAEMTNVSTELRAQLERDVPFSTLELERETRSSDGTIKALFRTQDDLPLEAVLMSYSDGRRSVCVSSQSGCPLTCTFCATGTMKFGRNLSGAEIVDQVLHFRRVGEVNHVVFMGMGEPLMNIDNVLAACEQLPDIGIVPRRTGVSTVGWIPGIERLAEQPLPLRLALSLHAPDDDLRSELMPINDRYPLADVLEACRSFYERKRRRVFVEYVMLADVNDSMDQAKQLGAILDRRHFKVNLIPYNPTGMFEGSSSERIDQFRKALEHSGIETTVRLTRGRDIEAACGQLAAVRPG